MDETNDELVRQLYTRIGTIMEDASVIALRLGGPGSGASQSDRDQLVAAIDALDALIKAARVLEE